MAAGGVSAALAGLVLVPSDGAESADHLDPPTRTDAGFDTTPDVPADIADVFAWHSNGTVKIAMTFAGPVATTAPSYYDRDVLYKIHISTKAPGTTDEFTIKARFGKGAGANDWGVRFEGVPGVGTIEGPVETNLEKDGVKARAGLFDEPFFFDLIGFRETRSFGQVRIRNNRNFFDGQNDTAVVFEIPDANFGGDVSQLEFWGQTLRFGGNL
ncbi:hypothetical protein OLX02_01455 [Novosphingobium sp. KCTC 2891]|uniref:hypothetical protein n=1 Tax=Novosphingobium sp. KCTC 2891 TaxID=2989730 RepID=UPI002221DE70|nr:hypothetical protein [Novosphingobium sp. KCTC 2891]MCW1381480.1 hypothetical protein [Novosphingobium sp. KCTC 2891]